VNPNGDTSTWSPLKAAIHSGNQRVARRILSHGKTRTLISPTGLQCDVLATVPQEVSFAVEAGDRECFKNHPRATRLPDDDAARRRLLGLPTAEEEAATRAEPPSEPGQPPRGPAGQPRGPGTTPNPAATSRGGASRQAAGTPPRATVTASAMPVPAELVVDPTPFASLGDVATYYFFGRFLHGPYGLQLGLLLGLNVAFPLLLVVGVNGLAADERRKRAQEEAAAAAPAPPAPDAAAAAAAAADPDAAPPAGEAPAAAAAVA